MALNKKDAFYALALWYLLIIFYALNGTDVIISGDCASSMFVPWAILNDHSFYLDNFTGVIGQHFNGTYFYTCSNGHVLSYYPILTPLVATLFYIPGYLILKTSILPIQSNPLFYLITVLSMRFTCIIITVLAVTLFYFTLRKIIDEKWAFIISLALGLTTELWNISSQILWQHGVSTLILCAMLFLVVNDIKVHKKYTSFLLIVCMALLFFNRPIDIILALPYLYYVLVCNRQYDYKKIVLLILILFLFLVCDIILTGSPVAGYTDKLVNFNPPYLYIKFHYNLMDQFFSINHGLLVYTPIIILSFIGIALMLYNKKWRGLTISVILSLILFVCALVIFAANPGACFGPRYYTETMPILFLYIGLIDEQTRNSNYFKFAFALLFLISLLIQVYGVFCAVY